MGLLRPPRSPPMDRVVGGAFVPGPTESTRQVESIGTLAGVVARTFLLGGKFQSIHPPIRTPRLLLRLSHSEDVPVLLRFLNDPSNFRPPLYPNWTSRAT